MPRFLLFGCCLLLHTLVLAACGGDRPAATDAPPDRAGLRLLMVTHGQASDPFWSVVQNGAAQAARDMHVAVEYQAPESFDMVMMAQLIDAAVASDPDGLIVSIPDGDALRPALEAAAAAGLPIISINAGEDVAAELGLLTHVGQTQYEAGRTGGERMAEAGVRNALCVNHEVGNVSLDERCRGFIDAVRARGGTATLLAVEAGDPTESQQRLLAALQADPTINGLMTLGPISTLAALSALESQPEGSARVELATFDLTPEVVDAIEDGDVLFAIDQQQYLQGYLPVVLLTLYLTNANTLAHDVVRTGPGFVTAQNVGRFRELSRRGTR